MPKIDPEKLDAVLNDDWNISRGRRVEYGE